MKSVIQEKKIEVRQELKEKRSQIAADRRSQAQSECVDALSAIARTHPFVLSYSSIGDELSTKGLNHFLEEEGKLVLPRVVDGLIKVYHVKDSAKELEVSPFGIMEPKLSCEEVDLEKIGLVLVPGLGFDSGKHRIGYGKGYYDRFLSLMHDEAITIGIGFREQYFAGNLPVEETDKSLTAVLLF